MVDFIDEMTQDFIDYCYQTNVERAFPAIDGLKPGQRACLYEMYRKGYLPSKPHVKSAKVSGGVIAELWPHGDVAIYDTFARMAQPFTNNVPLCEFHGNCGNQMIPEAASSRYTEVRLSKAGLQLFDGLKKKNVPFILSFDETTEWPEVLPSPLPYLLINGSEGIGTTIAQKWLPYDAKEITEAYMNYIKTGEMDYTIAPSFPSGGVIINKNDVGTILKTGKGKIILRAKAEIKKNIISITEICYQTCVRDLMEEFKDLYSKDELPGVEDIQNLSGKNGIKINIICESKASPAQVLNMLYSKTNLQKSYSANQNLLIGKLPQLVSTQTYFDLLYKHNNECLLREYNYDLSKNLIKKEEYEGLVIAIANLDDIISIVRNSADKASAKKSLIAKYNFTEIQAEAILKMTIGQLTKLDSQDIQNELQVLISAIDDLNKKINDKEIRKNVIIENLVNLVSKIKTTRKTELMQIELPSTKEEKQIAAVEPENVIVVTTQSGLIKRVPVASYKVQNRGGKGVKSEDDIILSTIKTNTVDTMMFFTDKGVMYRTLVDNIPAGTSASKGTPINSFVKLDANEKVVAVSSLHRTSMPKYIIFITAKGMLKKSLLSEYINMNRNTGVKAMNLKEDDKIVNILFQDEEEILLITKDGMSIRFTSKDISAVGRIAQGIKSIKLSEGDEVVSAMSIHKTSDDVAIITTSGLGKKTPLSDFPIQGRNGKGTKVSEERIAGAAMVDDKDNLLLIGRPNNICISAASLPQLSRTSLGNKVIKSGSIVTITKM